jgi:hypothetical protein
MTTLPHGNGRMRGFTAIPNDVVQDGSLSLDARGLYATLLTYAGQTVSYEAILRAGTSTADEINGALGELIERRLIEVRPDGYVIPSEDAL